MNGNEQPMEHTVAEVDSRPQQPAGTVREAPERTQPGDEEAPVEWLARRLATAAGALAAVYAFAYLLGYRYLSEYFQTLGARWAIDLYGPSAIAQAPSSFAIVVCALAITLVTHLDDFAGGKYRQSLWPLAIAGIFLAVHLVIKWFFTSYESFWWIGALIFALHALFWTVATFTSDVVSKRGRNQAAGLILMLMALTAFFGAPLVAQIKAVDIKSSGASGLAVVKTSANDDGKPWRLIRATPDGRLIVARSTGEQTLEFRVLDVTAATSILRERD